MFYFLKVDHHLLSGETYKAGFKPDEHKIGQILAKVCLDVVAALIFYYLAPGIP